MRRLAIGAMMIAIVGCQSTANTKETKAYHNGYPICKSSEWGYPFPSLAEDGKSAYIFLSKHPVKDGPSDVPGEDILCVYQSKTPVMVMEKIKEM